MTYPKISARLVLVALFGIGYSLAQADTIAGLESRQWIHGAADCNENREQSLEVFQYNQDTFVMRQNKCLTYEAPFLYLLKGKKQSVLIDTGDLENESLYETVRELTGPGPLLVIHTHGHSDHYRADAEFEGKPNTVVVEPDQKAMRRYFGFNDWPQGERRIDLVGRELVMIPTPGHHEDAISIYDSQTQWLLTGDTLYPGYIYVKDWLAYRASIAKLRAFTEVNTVSRLMGSHIEMSNRDGESYPIGTTYQPNEAPLPIAVNTLVELDNLLKATDRPTEISLGHVTVKPMTAAQKALSNFARWIKR